MVIAATAPDVPVLFIGILATGACLDLDGRGRQHARAAARRARAARPRDGGLDLALPGTIPITALVAGGAADLFGPRVAYAAVGAVIAGVATRLLARLRRTGSVAQA